MLHRQRSDRPQNICLPTLYSWRPSLAASLLLLSVFVRCTGPAERVGGDRGMLRVCPCWAFHHYSARVARLSIGRRHLFVSGIHSRRWGRAYRTCSSSAQVEDIFRNNTSFLHINIRIDSSIRPEDQILSRLFSNVEHCSDCSGTFLALRVKSCFFGGVMSAWSEKAAQLGRSDVPISRHFYRSVSHHRHEYLFKAAT